MYIACSNLNIIHINRLIDVFSGNYEFGNFREMLKCITLQLNPLVD